MNADEIKGKLQNAFGKTETAVGGAIGSNNLKDAGAEDQMKGAAKETWGNAKDAVSQTGETISHNAATTRNDAAYETGKAQGHVESGTGTFRDKVVTGADNLKNSFENKVDNYKADQAARRD